MNLPMMRKPDKLQREKSKARASKMISKYQLELIIESGAANYEQARVLATFVLDTLYK